MTLETRTDTDARTDTRTGARELPLAPDGEVVISVVSGHLRIRGTDEPVVRVRRRDGGEPSDDVTFRAEAGRVSVTSREEGLRLGPLTIGISRGRSVDLDVDLPRGAHLTVRTASGDVEARGLAGASEVTTVSGSLELGLEAGTLAFQAMSGDVDVEASGPVAIDGRTVSGDVGVRAPLLLGLRVESTSGDVAIDAGLDAGRVHEISTVSGDVRIATDSDVRVETRTVAGDIEASVPHRTEGSKGRRAIVVGGGSVAVAVRTMSGDIRVRSGRRGHATDLAGAPTAPPAPAPRPAPAAPPAPGSHVDPAPSFATQGAWSAADPAVDRREAARLEILRALERGELDVDAASRRLEVLEDAGPRSFRGWV
jgi:hypothetical protein